jgi:hypothetical protein
MAGTACAPEHQAAGMCGTRRWGNRFLSTGIVSELVVRLGGVK